jgi:ribosome-associated toxin RatA of RatAB toxin-antitoxin module
VRKAGPIRARFPGLPDLIFRGGGLPDLQVATYLSPGRHGRTPHQPAGTPPETCRCGRATAAPISSWRPGSLRCMADSSVQSITMTATPTHIAAVICDFPSYPKWAEAMKQVEVLEEYEDGYASQVRFTIDAGVVSDVYTLAYEYAEDISRIQWHLVEPSRMQKTQSGSYDITDNGDGTCTVTYTLEVDLSIGMLGMFRRKAEKMIMDTALKELKRRVEAP